MGLLGDFVGNTLGLQSGQEYASSVNAASKLRDLQRRNQAIADMRDFAQPSQSTPISSVEAFNPDDSSLSFDNLQQPGLRNIPLPPKPPVDQEGGVAQGIDEADKADGQTETPPSDITGSFPSPPTVPEFDSGQTVINPNDNQNIPNNQIPVPEFTNPDLSSLFPEGVVSENDVSDEDKQSLHVQGFPWKVIDKNGGKVVVHNGVEYNIKDMGDGSFILTNRMGMPNYPLTDAFTKGRARGITDTEIKPRTSSSADDLAAATVDNSLIANALDSIRNNKFQNGITSSTAAYAQQFGIDQGEALALLAIESNFGNVKFDSRSSTRGPLQVQNLAFKDVKAYFKGPKPDGIDVTDDQWAAMTAAAAKLPKNHANLTDTNDQIAAGLLYFKMIGLKGVDKRFQAAAYFDGYGKYIGINDISDVKKFSGPNTLASVTKYNSAFLGMRDYMGQVADYYYPQGGAFAGASTTTQGNTVGQTVPSQTSTTQTQTTQATENTDVSTAMPAAGLNTGQQQTQTSTSGYEIRQEDGPVVYKDGKPVMRFAGEDGQKRAEEYIAGETGTGSIASPSVQPDENTITRFLENPPNIGIEMNNLLKQRELTVNSINRQLQLTNEKINAANAKAAEYDRYAEIALANGQVADFERYKGLAQTEVDNARTLRDESIIARDGKQIEILQYDNKMLLVQGAQALRDLSFGSTARAGAVMSAFTGLDIKIQPRSDGKFDIVVQGNVQQTLTMAQLSDRLQRTYSQAYRDSQTKIQTERQTYLFEKSVDLEVKLAEEQAKFINQMKTDQLKYEAERFLEKMKQMGGEFKALGNGMALVQQGGQFFLVNPTKVVKGADGKAEERLDVQQIPLAQAMALLSSTSQGEDFVAATE